MAEALRTYVRTYARTHRQKRPRLNNVSYGTYGVLRCIMKHTLRMAYYGVYGTYGALWCIIVHMVHIVHGAYGTSRI